jgi:hypothetical protein
MKITRPIAVAGVVGLTALLAACNSSSGANGANAKVENQQLGIYNTAQPLPIFSKSQLRQTAIDFETEEAEPTASTTFFFDPGAPNPIMSCPSIGFPVPTTDQLSNPDQITRVNTGNSNYESGVVGEIDPTGVYSGDSSGTDVLCLNSSGQQYGVYWEGFTFAVAGATSWNYTTHEAANVTNPTGHFTVLAPGSVHTVAPTTSSNS